MGQRERQAASMAQVMFDLITDPATMPPLLPTAPGSTGDGDPDTATRPQHPARTGTDRGAHGSADRRGRDR
ncbi:MAG: hypothetical protein IPJ14_15520 [Kineosporiaceae bacterium]|nr:hypothetical protein [Kineosporiaceae bacterium]